jgi:hypothetical protein
MRLAHSLLAAARTGVAATTLVLAPAVAQSPVAATPAAAPAVARGATAEHPFAPGEVLTYDVRFGSLKVGTGSMEVRSIAAVRGRPAYHTVFRVNGGTAFFKVNDVFESWFATDDLSSLRFYKDQEEGWKERTVRYDIFPERGTYDEITDQDGEQPSVRNPLDDGSFLYFLRTVPLAVGQTYQFDRYFKPDRNPVTIRVLRRERVKVPAGEFDAVVVQPTIKTKGIFSEGGRAEVWISDDDRRIVLQMKSRLSFGSLNLYLKSAKAGRPATR